MIYSIFVVANKLLINFQLEEFIPPAAIEFLVVKFSHLSGAKSLKGNGWLNMCLKIKWRKVETIVLFSKPLMRVLWMEDADQTTIFVYEAIDQVKEAIKS